MWFIIMYRYNTISNLWPVKEINTSLSSVENHISKLNLIESASTNCCSIFWCVIGSLRMSCLTSLLGCKLYLTNNVIQRGVSEFHAFQTFISCLRISIFFNFLFYYVILPKLSNNALHFFQINEFNSQIIGKHFSSTEFSNKCSPNLSSLVLEAMDFSEICITVANKIAY